MEESNIGESTFVGVSYVALSDTHYKLKSTSELMGKLNDQVEKIVKESGNVVNALLKHTDDLTESLKQLFSDITVQKEEPRPVEQPKQQSIDVTTESIEKIIQDTEDALKRLGSL